MRIYTTIILSGLAFLLAACNNPRLYGRLERLNPNILVSHALNTPDPRSQKQIAGQRLVVSWILPPSLNLKNKDCYLKVEITTIKGDRLERQKLIQTHWGHWEFEVPSEKIKEGYMIVTYCLRIEQAGRILRTFEHRLYKPVINMDAEESDIGDLQF